MLCDYVKALDLNIYNALFVKRTPADLVAEAVDLITSSIEIR